MKKRIAIDMGGTKTEIMLTGNDPFDIIERKRVPTQREKGYQFIIHHLADLIAEYTKLCDEPPHIGIGIPGSINVKTGLVRNANTVCLIGHPLKKDLEALVDQAIFIENDANCFALAEAVLGAGKGYDMVMGLIMGTGMGGGLVLSGSIWSGLQGIAGEFGHTSIDYNGPPCWCGENGCLEVYISGTAVEKNYQGITGTHKTLKEIYQDFEDRQEPAAKQVLDDLLFYFGRGIANLITSFDPDIVVIGGGVSNISLLYTAGVDQVRQRIFNDDMDTPIVKNQLGDSSGIYGAALLAGT
ncbi:MAG: ROK family protein [Proteobacteria bacterium]|nr:ROK family protein [Pseudomonadota bacterium]